MMRQKIAVLLGVAALLLLGGIAYASIPGPDHVLDQNGKVVGARAFVDDSQGGLQTLTVIAICANVD